MNFEEIKKKCPKGWKSFQDCVTKARIEQTDEEYEFLELYGYLVLEFFPSHGIEIERYISVDHGVVYYIYIGEKIPTMNRIHTPQEAIARAFEILEDKDE